MTKPTFDFEVYLEKIDRLRSSINSIKNSIQKANLPLMRKKHRKIGFNIKSYENVKKWRFRSAYASLYCLLASSTSSIYRK